MANSSQFALPIGIAPAPSIRATAVAVYGAIQFSKILLPQVVRVPSRHMLSLTAMGTPASGGRSPARTRSSTRAAQARASSGSTVRYEPTFASTDATRSRVASVTSAALVAAPATSRAVSAALFSIRGDAIARLLFRDDTRNAEEAALPLRRLRQHALPIQARHGTVLTHYVTRLDDLCRRGDAGGVELAQRVDVFEQIPELLPEDFDLFIGQCEARELRDVTNVDGTGRQDYAYSNTARASTWPVCGNMSNGVTAPSR